MAQQKIRRDAARKGTQVQPATLRFAEYVIVFTTFPEPPFSAADVLESGIACAGRSNWCSSASSRWRSWGTCRSTTTDSAKAWLYGKLFVALLVEKLLHHARTNFPLGLRRT